MEKAALFSRATYIHRLLYLPPATLTTLTIDGERGKQRVDLSRFGAKQGAWAKNKPNSRPDCPLD